MEQQRLNRLGGLLFTLSGALMFLSTLLHPSDLDATALQSAMWKPAHLGMLVANLLALPGLAVLHMQMVRKGGVPALTGFVLAMLGTGLFASQVVVEGLVLPTAIYAKGDPQPMMALGYQLGLAACPAFGVGYVLSAVAAHKARLMPKAASIMLGAGAGAMTLLMLVGHGAALVVALPASGLFFSAAQVWFGASIVGKATSARTNEPDTM
jgi:hypothetical protein